MNDEEYKIEFEKFKKNVKAYVPKHEVKIFYFNMFTTVTVCSFIINYVLYKINEATLFFRVDFLLLKMEYMVVISVLLITGSFLLHRYFLKTNKEVLEFKNYIYTGKLSELININEPTVMLRKDFLRKIIELENGIPSEIICDLYENIIEGSDNATYLKSLNTKKIIEELE